MPTKLPRKVISLAPDDLAALAQVRKHFGLPTEAAAVRYAIHQEARRIEATPARRRTKGERKG